MEKQIYNNNLKINYDIKGKGNTVVLIHGFLETSATWKSFADLLSSEFSVISVDLPGHGKSDIFDEPYTMCKYADSVYAVLKSENTQKAVIIGHSMGGYVALAFAENYPSMLSGLCLFHSIPFSDSDEKKQLRNEVISRIKSGNKDIVCSNHAKAVYADDNTERFRDKIKEGEKIAISISEEGIIASLSAMRDRKDRHYILEKLRVPFLYIFGNKDRFIQESVLEAIKFPKLTDTAILENSGHMGMIEEKEMSLKIIRNFCKKIYDK